MRRPVDAARIREVLRRLGRAATRPARTYLTGGATAVLHGWRDSTIDVDLKLVPDHDEILRAMARIKERLEVNLELQAPDDFIPPLPGWEDRSLFIEQAGALAFFHYDPYAQTLAKLERGHTQDLEDAHRMVADGLVRPEELRLQFERIEPNLYRYPAIDPATFCRAVERFLGSLPR
jgi:hypothetical protein